MIQEFYNAVLYNIIEAILKSVDWRGNEALSKQAKQYLSDVSVLFTFSNYKSYFQVEIAAHEGRRGSFPLENVFWDDIFHYLICKFNFSYSEYSEARARA